MWEIGLRNSQLVGFLHCVLQFSKGDLYEILSYFVFSCVLQFCQGKYGKFVCEILDLLVFTCVVQFWGQ